MRTGQDGGLRRRWWRALLLVGLLLPLLSAVPAAAGGSADLSDDSPQPGQTVTVSAIGLQANKEAVIDYVPDAVRLATVTVGADGSFARDVTIPVTTYDGPKEIVITALDAAGRFSRLKLPFTMAGPPASAALSDMTLVPSQVVRITGERWYAGGQVLAYLFPEGTELGPLTASSSGRISKDVRLPAQLLNGKHGVQLFGRAAGGRMANIKLFPTVSGGVGQAGDLNIPDDPTASTLPTTTTSERTTTTFLRAPLAPVEDDGPSWGTIFLIAFCVVVLVVVVVAWWNSSEGRAWRRSRQQRLSQKRARKRG